MFRVDENKPSRIKNIPELLAPAGNYHSFIAAVQAGANAVYLGGKNFSARNYAENFSEEEISEIVSYAHARGVKVYVTVNTLVSPDEVGDCLEYVSRLKTFGIDALIVQDTGLIRLLRKELPALSLHASTQMTIHNLEGANLCYELGMDRVILSREMTVHEIQNICANSPIGIEVFVHGAMCYSYSGRCLLSSFIGARSGNRGRCSQPCRMEYTLLKKTGNKTTKMCAAGKHLISCKDLCLVNNLEQLVDTGVSSLKIEGRMKSPEYVGIVVSIYRKNLDRIENLSWSGPLKEEMRDLKQVFNRQFTSGYFNNPYGQDIIGYNTPSNRGLFVGRIKEVGKNSVKIELKQDLALGDQIQIWTRKGRVIKTIDGLEINGASVESASEGSMVSLPLKQYSAVGDRVFKVYDNKLMHKALSLYKSPREQVKIPIKASFFATPGVPACLTLTDPEGEEVSIKSTKTCEAPHKHALTKSQARSHIDRLGNTPFVLEKFVFNCSEEVMLPFSVINDMRREAVDKLLNIRSLKEQESLSFAEKGLDECFNEKPLCDETNLRGQSKIYGESKQDVDVEPYVEKVSLGDNRPHYAGSYDEVDDIDGSSNHGIFQGNSHGQNLKETVSLVVSVGDIASMEGAIKGGAKDIYFQSVNPRNLKIAANMAQANGIKLSLRLPSIVIDSQRQRINDIIDTGINLGIDTYITGDLGTLFTLKKKGLKSVSDYQCNIFNAHGCHFMKTIGAARVTLSPELSLALIKKIVKKSPLPCEVLVHGYIPLITSRHNVISPLESMEEGAQRKDDLGNYYLKDRKNILFPVKVKELCYTEILNSVPLIFIEHINKLISHSVRYLRIETSNHTPAQICETTAAYRNEINEYIKSPETYGPTDEAKDFVNYVFSGLHTKGHYFRGV